MSDGDERERDEVEGVAQIVQELHALNQRMSRLEHPPQFLQRTAEDAQRQATAQHQIPPREPVVMRERLQRTRGIWTSEFLVTAVLGLGGLVFTGFMMWLWVTHPEADWTMLLNAVVIPAAAWLGKTYISARQAEKVERIRQGEQV